MHPETATAPTLTLPELRAAQARIERATDALRDAFSDDSPDAQAVRRALFDGAAFERVGNPQPRGSEAFKAPDLWQYALDARRLDLFEALLDADAARLEPDFHSPHLIARTAVHAPPQFLEALLARGPDLHRLGPTSFLPYNQASSCLVGPLRTGNDRALDRLLDAGADPRLAPQPPVYPGNEHRLAPRSMLHLVCTVHAARRLTAAGLDPKERDEFGRNAVELAFDHLTGLARMWAQNRDTMSRQRGITRDLVIALLDAGVPSEFFDSEERLRGTALTRAVGYRMTDLVSVLRERGLTWPNEVAPQGPREAVHALSDEVPLPLAESGARWLAGWLQKEAGWHLEEQRDALATLVRHGLPLTQADPETGLTPLLSALQAGNYHGLTALVAAQLPLHEHPGGGDEARCTWGQLLEETVLNAVGDYGEHWARISMRRLGQQKQDKLSAALKELGIRPDLGAAAKAQALGNQLAPADGTAGRPRL